MFNDHQRCYRVVESKDRRFDGYFVTAVRTTGIYCRPSCPARTPKPSNVSFFATAAAAQSAGYRACKRCLPDASPGSPQWNVQSDVAARAMRLIADGVVDRDGVGGLASQLGYSERQLNRLLLDAVGAGPLALARSQRANHARILVETTDMAMVDVAFGAGFASLRQFNDTMRQVFDATPTELRVRRRRPGGTRSSVPTCAPAGESGRSAMAISLRLPYRAPLDASSLLAFLAARCVSGVERVEDGLYVRTLRLHSGHAVVRLRIEDTWVKASLRLSDVSDLAAAVARCRRLLDLDADPVAVDDVLARDAALAPLVASRPGLRSPGSVDGYEMAVRAILGQQVSVRSGLATVNRLVRQFGEESTVSDGSVHRQFPTANAIAAVDPSTLAMPKQRSRALWLLSAAVANGDLRLDPGADRSEARARLLEVVGIGPWTADYIAMRALGDPDVWAGGDLVVRQRATKLGIDPGDLELRARRWAPWRSSAVHHLWAASESHQLGATHDHQ